MYSRIITEARKALFEEPLRSAQTKLSKAKSQMNISRWEAPYIVGGLRGERRERSKILKNAERRYGKTLARNPEAEHGYADDEARDDYSSAEDRSRQQNAAGAANFGLSRKSNIVVSRGMNKARRQADRAAAERGRQEYERDKNEDGEIEIPFEKQIVGAGGSALGGPAGRAAGMAAADTVSRAFQNYTLPGKIAKGIGGMIGMKKKPPEQASPGPASATESDLRFKELARRVREMSEERKHTPAIERRCVADVMRKNPSYDLSRAFAICRSSMQKGGVYKKGTAQLTKKGAARSAGKDRAKDDPSKKRFFVKQVKAARKDQ